MTTPLGRTLYDITQVLESAEGSDQRVRHVLGLLRALVPYDHCGMFELRLGHDPYVVLVPEPPPDERAALTVTLHTLFGRLVETDGSARPATLPLPGAHLAVPLVGLDEVIGLLFVRSATERYDEDHLRALSVVAAKLAAYSTTLRARADLLALVRERDEARRAAEAANQTKDEFLALVSHELKAPLTSILGWTQVLRSADAPARARALDHLEDNVRAQSKLIDDVLDLACIASAGLRLHLRIVEPAALIKEKLEELRWEAERKSIRLASDLDGDAMPLMLDPERIGQVVSILVANAIKFTPAGGQVAVHLERAAGHARIRVSDSGRGISGDALPHVFDPFQKAAGAGPGVPPGLGVGLAIVKDLVELHGGRVRAESDGLDRGATFTVELPRLPEPRVAQRPLAQRDERRLAGLRVLLLDHDLTLRESLYAALDEHGAEVTAVASAPDALAALERARPDVILVGDLAVQGEAVYDLMRVVTARICPLPIASISAWRLEERAREQAAGFRAHLSKPLEIRALVDAVADLAGLPSVPDRASAG